ncbi:hypothetical protein PsorP6_009099 [Peronosclerospora sorghi]|uniref:Uncharacterized protein n=1 Tax=Peronosclerospora sorghi TaxID=230839 RepID=A0ACC0VYF4_9STRA|nr:hypothetical protein PsorP6_009099 [Peronosclerospora sorghi]
MEILAGRGGWVPHPLVQPPQWLQCNTLCPMCKSNVDLDAVTSSDDSSCVASKAGVIDTRVSTAP